MHPRTTSQPGESQLGDGTDLLWGLGRFSIVPRIGRVIDVDGHDICREEDDDEMEGASI